MASRLKEDERNERSIRNLLKLPENRRCINCNSLGPQYVCTTFWTFICTTCSGIHREFTHRVKSISMAKFTSQEVRTLQGGGNASAKEIYLKEWDPQRNSLPDGSNVERLRNFIKHVYVERRYAGEKSFDKTSKEKMGEMEDANQNRRLDAFQGDSWSPPYETTHELQYSGRASPAGRSSDGSSPGYDQDSFRQGDNKRSPAQAEVINDWRREDRFRNGRIFEDNRNSKVGSTNYPEISSPPVVRPVREILGENISPLRVIEPPRANGARSANVSVRTQRTASSSSLASSNGNPAETKTETSLIDFDAVPEPPSTAPAPQTLEPLTGRDNSQQTAPSVGNDWANFDSLADIKVEQAPSNANTLESVLSEFSVPTSIPAQYGETSVSGGASIAASASNAWDFTSSNSAAVSLVPPFTSGPAAPPMSHSIAIPPAGAPGVALPALGSQVPGGIGSSYVNAANGEQWTNKQPQQPTVFLGSGNVTTPQPFSPAAGGTPSNQAWNASVAPNSQGPPHATVAQTSSLAAIIPGLEANTGAMTNTPAALPEDLFAAPIHGWHTGPPHGYGFNMQYRMHMPMPTFQQLQKSMNPFDVGNQQTPIQASSFPSMTSLQGALPNMVATTGLMRTSSLGTPSSTWTGPHPSQPLAVPPQGPSFKSAALPGMYSGQETPSNIPLRPQGAAGFDLGDSPFGSLNPNQQLGGFYSQPPTQNTLSSVGGNPFG